MLQRICLAAMLSFFLLISCAYADMDDESDCEKRMNALVHSVVPEKAILCTDMTSMDIRTGNGIIYVISREDEKYNFLILEISRSEIESVKHSTSAVYQDRGVPELSVETDGEVTAVYPTGERTTFIRNGDNWFLSGYSVVTEENDILNIGFPDQNFAECMEMDADGVVKKRTKLPFAFNGSLLFEQVDVQSLPRSLTELRPPT